MDFKRLRRSYPSMCARLDVDRPDFAWGLQRTEICQNAFELGETGLRLWRLGWQRRAYLIALKLEATLDACHLSS